MNVEIDKLKKEVTNLRKDVDFLKNVLITRDVRKHYRILLNYIDDKVFNKNIFIKDVNSKVELGNFSYTANQNIDTTYNSPLFPDTTYYKNNVTIFLTTHKPILPMVFKEHISNILKDEFEFKHYDNVDEFYSDSSAYSLISCNVSSISKY